MGDGVEGGPTRVVALDGPSGSGKSTVAKGVARALGWRYVDTGATYRAATLAVLRAGVAPSDEHRVGSAVQDLLARHGLELSTDPDRPGVVLDGTDVSAEIRGAAVTSAVSAVSAVPAVRAGLVAFQREVIGEGDAVVEGRDIGSVVAPSAVVKVFLDADQTVRAARRAVDVDSGVDSPAATAAADADAAPGASTDSASVVAAVAADLARRDHLDSTRTTSPLAQPDDAVHVDATHLTADEVVAVVLRLAHEAGLAGDAATAVNPAAIPAATPSSARPAPGRS